MSDFVKVIKNVNGYNNIMFRIGDVLETSILNDNPFIDVSNTEYFVPVQHKYKIGDEVMFSAHFTLIPDDKRIYTIQKKLYSIGEKAFYYQVVNGNNIYKFNEKDLTKLVNKKYYIDNTGKCVKECDNDKTYDFTYDSYEEAADAIKCKLLINDRLSKIKKDPDCRVDMNFNDINNLIIIYNALKNYDC